MAVNILFDDKSAEGGARRTMGSVLTKASVRDPAPVPAAADATPPAAPEAAGFGYVAQWGMNGSYGSMRSEHP